MRKTFLILFFLFIFLNFSTVYGQRKGVKPPKKVNIQKIEEKPPVEDGEWEYLISSEGNFQILFPAPPERIAGKNESSRDGKYVEYKLATNIGSYSVSFADYNFQRELFLEERQKFYDFLEAGVIKAVNTTLLKKENFAIGDVSGREISFAKQDFIYVNRYFLHKNRLYQILTSTRKQFNKDDKIKTYRRKFLDSFQVLEK